MPIKDPIKNKEYMRAYYKRNKQKFIDKANKWYAENKQRAAYIKKASFGRKRYEGELTADVVQMVYEDNIKKFGTLTCMVCGGAIMFGEDALDHNVSLSKGGTNTYDNLCVVHHRCNSVKKAQTLKEVRRRRL